MKYFVTGATGFIGGRLAHQLKQAGHEVIALVRDLERAKKLSEIGIELALGDVTDKESMRLAMAGTDGVFHVAGWYKIGVRDKSQAVSVNVHGTRNVLELMKELKIPKGVYTSSLAVNSDTHGRLVDETYRYSGPYLSEYERTKAEAHRIAESFIEGGLPLVIVMPGLVYGPGDTSVVRLMLIDYLRRKLPLVPQKTACNWAHVDDTALVHRLAMDKGRIGHSYIIGGPVHTIIDSLEIIETITAIRKPLSAPPALFKFISILMRTIEKIISLPEFYTSEGLRMVSGVTYIGDNSKAIQELDFQPRSLQDGLKETLQHEMKLLAMSIN